MKNRKPVYLLLLAFIMIVGILGYEQIGPYVQNFISAMQVGNIGSITHSFQP